MNGEWAAPVPASCAKLQASMKKIVRYIRDYAAGTDKRLFMLSTVFIGVFIFINYRFRLNYHINSLPEPLQYAGWYAVFFLAFSFAYLCNALLNGKKELKQRSFLVLLLLAPLLFAWKMAFDMELDLSPNRFQNNYWNQVLYWPYKLVGMTAALWLVWKLRREDQPFYGCSLHNFKARPYWIMLLIMVPLVAAASTQPDFLAVYPKLKNVAYLRHLPDSGLYKLLFELSYGSDFVGIELFFRGFLVLAFVWYAGQGAILPMALFYCTIHFGKPLGECISSYFGGLLLGIVTYHTRTIAGGLMVHLGIAWMMELGGYLGNLYR